MSAASTPATLAQLLEDKDAERSCWDLLGLAADAPRSDASIKKAYATRLREPGVRQSAELFGALQWARQTAMAVLAEPTTDAASAPAATPAPAPPSPPPPPPPPPAPPASTGWRVIANTGEPSAAEEMAKAQALQEQTLRSLDAARQRVTKALDAQLAAPVQQELTELKRATATLLDHPALDNLNHQLSTEQWLCEQALRDGAPVAWGEQIAERLKLQERRIGLKRGSMELALLNWLQDESEWAAAVQRNTGAAAKAFAAIQGKLQWWQLWLCVLLPHWRVVTRNVLGWLGERHPKRLQRLDERFTKIWRATEWLPPLSWPVFAWGASLVLWRHALVDDPVLGKLFAWCPEASPGNTVVLLAFGYLSVTSVYAASTWLRRRMNQRFVRDEASFLKVRNLLAQSDLALALGLILLGWGSLHLQLWPALVVALLATLTVWGIRGSVQEWMEARGLQAFVWFVFGQAMLISAGGGLARAPLPHAFGIAAMVLPVLALDLGNNPIWQRTDTNQWGVVWRNQPWPHVARWVGGAWVALAVLAPVAAHLHTTRYATVSMLAAWLALAACVAWVRLPVWVDASAWTAGLLIAGIGTIMALGVLSTETNATPVLPWVFFCTLLLTLTFGRLQWKSKTPAEAT